MEEVGDRVSADVDLQARVDGVADLRVAPGEVLLGEPDDQLADLVGLARPTLAAR